MKILPTHIEKIVKGFNLDAMCIKYKGIMNASHRFESSDCFITVIHFTIDDGSFITRLWCRKSDGDEALEVTTLPELLVVLRKLGCVETIKTKRLNAINTFITSITSI